MMVRKMLCLFLGSVSVIVRMMGRKMKRKV